MKGQERTSFLLPLRVPPGISRPNFVLLAAAAGLILDQQDAGVAVALLGLGRLLVRVVVPPLGAADRGRRAVPMGAPPTEAPPIAAPPTTAARLILMALPPQELL